MRELFSGQSRVAASTDNNPSRGYIYGLPTSRSRGFRDRRFTGVIPGCKPRRIHPSFVRVARYSAAALASRHLPFYDELMKSAVKVLPIEVDWRFGILERMGRVRLKELMDFHEQAEKTFENAMAAWQEEVKEFEAKYEDADGDHLSEQREEIESLLDRGHTFGVVGLYTFLERFLNLVIEHLRAGGAQIPPSKMGLSLHKIRAHLAEFAKIDMNRPPFYWKALERLQEIRNRIVHADGWITDDFVGRFAKVGMRVKEDTPFKLPTNYFEEAWKLVDHTYKAVYKGVH